MENELQSLHFDSKFLGESLTGLGKEDCNPRYKQWSTLEMGTFLEICLLGEEDVLVVERAVPGEIWLDRFPTEYSTSQLK